MSRPKAIIPCAGYGTRLNMGPNESKEMLWDTRNAMYLIDYSLILCEKYDLDPLVITRSEKKDLIDYCTKDNVEVLIIEPEGEWPSTILASKELWAEDNVLILPDTRFTPESILYGIKDALSMNNKAVIALHRVSDVSKWGSIENYHITEKSKDTYMGHAWGLIGFKQDYGEELFTAMMTRDKPFKLKDTGFLFLRSFDDITRVPDDKLIRLKDKP